MATWNDGVAALATTSQPHPVQPTRWLPGVRRVPIVITGASGAGKTEVWRRLTGKQAPDVASRRVDEGYLFPGWRRTRVAVTTIPGQLSRERYNDLRFYFGAAGRLDGVVFVASFGFDRVWPHDTDLVASDLPQLTLDALRQRNVDRELASFRETCDRLRQRNFADRRLPAPWLLVLVNKADLFYSALSNAARYYTPGSQSPFEREAARLRQDLGDAAGFRYQVVPASLRPGEYRLSSSRGTVEAACQIGQERANSSIAFVIETVKELSSG